MSSSPPEDTPGEKEIAARLDLLADRLRVGDVTPKRYARSRQELLAQLGRLKVAPFLEKGEAVVAEHHWVQGHPKIPDSVLKETAQVACSLYATDRRLFRWRFQDRGVPGAAPLEDVPEGLEHRWFRDIAALLPGGRRRWGEAAAGAAILGVAVLLWRHLQVTGYFLAGVGLFGIGHALLFPTRWVSVESRRAGEEPWPVWAFRKKSGRELLAEVERRTRSERG